MKVVALKSFSAPNLSMVKGEVRDVADAKANPLINEGYLAEWIDPVELPAVTDADNGDVLKVVDGKWNKANAGGGGAGNYVIPFDMEHATLGATWQEIHDAFYAGKTCLFATEADDETTQAIVVWVLVDNGSYVVVFATASLGGSEIVFNPSRFVADSANGYPSFVSGE